METKSRILKWILIFGIVIVLNLFFNYALSLVYKNPSYDSFCPNNLKVIENINDKDQCVNMGGQWTVESKSVSKETGIKGYCDQQFTCRNNYETAHKIYDRNVFITLVILGVICVLLGNFISGNNLISVALSLGGVFSFVIASMRYWNSADDLIKVVILFISLSILIYIAIKKFKNN